MNTGCAAVKRRGRSPRPRIRRAQGGSNMSEGVHPSPSGMAPGSPAATNGFRGGVTIAVLALLLVAMTFYISSPLIPRTAAIALAVVGVATAFGIIPVRAPQDYYGGMVLALLGTFAIVASAELPRQRGFAF